MDASLVRRLLAELAGAAILCLFGIGAAVSVAAADAGGPGLLVVALAHGLALAVAIYAFGSVSGGHYNPTVTIALAARGRFPWREVPAYAAAQLVGGILGAALVYAAYAGTATAAGLGATTFGDVSFAGESVAWSQLLVYLVGPIVGGLAAAFLCDRIMVRRAVEPTVTSQV